MSTNPIPQSTAKTPKLRFPEFKDLWVERKLGEVLDYEQPTKYLVSSTEYDKKFLTPVLTAGKTFILGYTDESDGIFKDKLPVIIFDDFTTATQYVDFPFKAKSSAMKILHAKEDSNIKFAYETMQILDYEIGGHERHWISKHSQLIVNTPSFPEQNKIAEFLTAVDDKITLLDNQKKQLELYKKGLLQAMFPSSNNRGGGSTIRFLDISGISFPDWAERRLGEIGDIITGNTPSTTELNYYGGDYLFVSPADINNSRYVSNTKTTLSEFGFMVGRKVRKNSTLFVCIGSTIGKVAQNKLDCITNQQINSVVPNEQNNVNFIYSLLEFEAKKIKDLSATQAVPIVNKTTFSNYKSLFPSLPEQTKIANFLTSIDDKIAIVGDQITATKLWKRGLMQAMLV